MQNIFLFLTLFSVSIMFMSYTYIIVGSLVVHFYHFLVLLAEFLNRLHL